MLVYEAFFVLFIAAIALVGCIEKRMVWPYGELQIEPLQKDNNGYQRIAITQAFCGGFTFLGQAPDLKARFKVSYAFLVSPDCSTLALVSTGTVLGKPVQGTWMISIGRDGRFYYSVDNQECIEFDISRTRVSHLVRTNSFMALWQQHNEWISRLNVLPEPFEPGNELKQFQAFRQNQYQSMARQNMIRFTDANETHWRYTVASSVKFGFLNVLVGLSRALTFGRFPRSA